MRSWRAVQRWVWLATALGLLVVPHAAQALRPDKRLTQYVYRAWDSEQGLPQNSVIALAQTQDGYLWIATQEGLVRFDGIAFKVYDRRNAPEIKHPFISALLADRSGGLWIGTNGGGLTRMLDGRFEHFGEQAGLFGDTIFALHQTSSGALWVGSEAGLHLLEGARFRRYTTGDGLPHDVVRAITDAPDGTLWIGTDGGGVARFAGGAFNTLATKDGLGSDAIRALRVDSTGALWIGTRGGGLHELRDGRISRFTAADGLGSNGVWAIVEDRHHTLWIATDSGGVTRIVDGRFERFPVDHRLSTGAIYSLLEDREGTLWLGTDTRGVSQLVDGPITTWAEEEGLVPEVTWSVLQTRDGAVWIGTSEGLARFQGGKIRTWSRDDGLSGEMVMALEEDASGALWVGGTGGLDLWREGRRLARFRSTTFKDAVISTVRQQGADRVWFGTQLAGLHRLQPSTGDISSFGPEEGLTSKLISALLVGPGETLWVGTRQGLFRSVGERFVAVAPDKLSKTVITSLYLDGDGVLWAGTEGSGIVRIAGDEVRIISTADGLGNDTAYRILEDGLGFLWTSSNRGLWRVNKAELTALVAGSRSQVHSQRFGRSHGMKSPECQGGADPAGYRTRDGHLWFPTIKGVSVVDPSLIQRSPPPPPVYLESAIAEGLPLDLRVPVTLAPGTQNLQFEYAAPVFAHPKRVEYEYRLEGFDEDWVHAGERRIAYYSGLPPGDYVFTVRARNGGGPWSSDPPRYAFTLAPRFRQTVWFSMLWGLAAVLLVSFALIVWLLHLQRRQRALLAAMSERDRFISVASHELRTPVAALQLAVHVARRNAEKGLDRVERQARRLTGVVENLLQLAQLAQGNLPLQLETHDLVDWVATTVETQRPDAERMGATVQLHAAAPVVGTWDRERVTTIVRQLLSNAIRYGGPNLIDIQVTEREGFAELVVRDRGPGVDEKTREHLFQRFEGRPTREQLGGLGLGLWIARELVLSMEGTLTLRVPPDGGAAFLVRLPLRPSRR